MIGRNTLTRLALLGLAISGCDCGDESELRRVVPEIEVSPEQLDFGEVPLLATRRLSLAVNNLGSAPLTISGIDTALPFGVRFDAAQVPAGGRSSVEVTFTPTTADARASGSLRIASDADNLPLAEVSLSGQGVAGFLEIIPSEVIFDPTTVGTSRGVEVVVANRGLESVSGDLVPEGFARPEHFALTGLRDFLNPAPLVVSARSQVSLDLEYRPLEAASDEGVVRFETCGARCGYEIRIKGQGIGSILRLEPASLDFGFAPIGETTSRELALVNDGDDSVMVEAVQVVGTSEFSAATANVLPATLAGGARLPIVVDFLPTQASEAIAQLVVRTNDAAVPELRASLEGTGQGPLFIVQPTSIEFGVLVDQAPSRRAFLLLNGGSSDVRVLELSISGDPAFTLVDLPGLPAPLRSGETLGPSVEFRPTAEREYSATVTIRTDDPSTAEVTLPVTGAYAEEACQLEVQPGRIGFGLLPIGYSQTRRARLRNVGPNACNLLSGDFQPPRDPFFSTSAAFPVTIPVGGQSELEFSYAPTEHRDSKANFVLTTDDAVFPHRTITLVGTSNGYDDLFVLPEQVDFGSMRPGCTRLNREVTVFNAGTDAVTLDRITLTSSSSDILPLSITAPRGIAPGSSVNIALAYLATNVGADHGELEIEARDHPFPLTVPISGRGSLTPRQRESYTQSTLRQVDVLFVIDDSCSMYGEQDELSRNFASFINAAALRQIDFHIGITTTDATAGLGSPSQPRRGGELVGPFMTRSTSNLEGTFRAQANVGVDGSSNEQGLEAMLLAFQLAESGTGPNAGMFREGSARVVVFVTDEDDQSAADPVVYFNELRRRASYYVVAAVTGGLNGCVNPLSGDTAFPAQRYLNFLALTGGIGESICGNWASSLQSIGNAAFGLRLRFPLGRPADRTEPIRVTVDGVPSTSWSYDATDPAIVFTNPPREGSSIVIEYSPGC
ncbi:MAG: choice-of-anchor D domain-containing protein [Deltaproteobacteria bacterium]|nr:choice-of-anchor D domain-containing protein [Deltaproteobacteria bacterium]